MNLLDFELVKEEFGDDAFRRVRIKTVVNDFLFPTSNSATESAIEHAEIECDEIEFVPLPYLYSHDCKVYGIENAFKMWQWQYKNMSLNAWRDCNKQLSFNPNKNYRRKQSAALHFDLERAKALEVYEVYSPVIGWHLPDRHCKITNDFVTYNGYKIDEKDLRMKYPPKK